MDAPIDDFDVFEDTLQWLKFHIWRKLGDETPFDAFRRLLAKNIGAPGWKDTDHYSVERHQIRSYREKRTTAKLAHLPRGHARDKPKNINCPIIIAVVDRQERLLDGNTRINYWVNEGNSQLR